MTLTHGGYAPDALASRLRAARARLNALAGMLTEDAWLGPYAATVNPPLWEYGHIAWFQEHWCLRLQADADPAASPLLAPLLPARRPWVDWLYDSSRIPHTARWKAPLPSAQETLAYGAEVLEALLAKLRSDPSDELFYYAELSLYHECMHTEAWWMMWQHHGYAPPFRPTLPTFATTAQLSIADGPVQLGSTRGQGFVFDNEKWAHEVEVGAFEIDAQPVTCGAYAEFVADGGYDHPSLWRPDGRVWLKESGAGGPLCWRHTDGAWQLRRFDHWIDLPADEPVLHVNRHEAEAYCAWRARALPSVAQWLRAQSHPGFLLGRCWEWTSDWFAPYTGFAPDPYRDYSLPWFHTHAELRGAGSWVTDTALARPTYRNFFLPERRDPFVGFRTVRR